MNKQILLLALATQLLVPHLATASEKAKHGPKSPACTKPLPATPSKLSDQSADQLPAQTTTADNDIQLAQLPAATTPNSQITAESPEQKTNVQNDDILEEQPVFKPFQAAVPAATADTSNNTQTTQELASVAQPQNNIPDNTTLNQHPALALSAEQPSTLVANNNQQVAEATQALITAAVKATLQQIAQPTVVANDSSAGQQAQSETTANTQSPTVIQPATVKKVEIPTFNQNRVKLDIQKPLILDFTAEGYSIFEPNTDGKLADLKTKGSESLYNTQIERQKLKTAVANKINERAAKLADFLKAKNLKKAKEYALKILHVMVLAKETEVYDNDPVITLNTICHLDELLQAIDKQEDAQKTENNELRKDIDIQKIATDFGIINNPEEVLTSIAKFNQFEVQENSLQFAQTINALMKYNTDISKSETDNDAINTFYSIERILIAAAKHKTHINPTYLEDADLAAAALEKRHNNNVKKLLQKEHKNLQHLLAIKQFIRTTHKDSYNRDLPVTATHDENTNELTYNQYVALFNEPENNNNNQ